MLYIVTRGNNVLTTQRLRVSFEYKYWVFDTDDGVLEQANGYDIKALCAERPELFCNLILNIKKFDGLACDVPVPKGIYKLPNGTHYIAMGKGHMGFLCDTNRILIPYTAGGELVSSNTLVYWDKDGYFIPCYTGSRKVKLITIDDDISISAIKKNFLMDGCEELHQRLYDILFENYMGKGRPLKVQRIKMNN